MQSKKQTISIKTTEYLMLVAAYGFLIYKLVTFDNYAQLSNHFQQVGTSQYSYLLLVIALLFANVSVESFKWRYLLLSLEKISFSSALRSVLTGWLAAFVTPNRLGEFPCRALQLSPQNRVSGIALGAVGSLAQTLIIVLCGLPACIVFSWLTNWTDYQSIMLWSYVGILFFLVAICLFIPAICRRLAQKPRKNARLQLMFDTLGHFSISRFSVVCGLSFLRYLIFSIQFAFLLVFFGVQISVIEFLIAIPTYYLFVTFTPSISIAEMAVRGSWSVIVFSAFTPNTIGVALSAVVLWFINTVLPMLVGSVLKKNF